MSCPGELAAEEEERQIRPDDRHGQDRAVHETQPGAGQQIVRQRVAEEPLEQAEEQQRPAEQPVDLTGLAERAGEEVPHHVHEHPGDEDQRGPVVHLPDQQSAPYVEADVQRRGVRLRHAHAVQRDVTAVVRHLVHRGVEEQRQVDAGEDQYDEAAQADLPEQERPVVREHLAQILPAEAVGAETAVEPVGHTRTRGRLIGCGPARGRLSYVVIRRRPCVRASACRGW